MNRSALDLWVCQSNIQRFQFLLRRAEEDDGRRVLADLLAREEERLRELNRAQERRWRLAQLGGAGPARAVIENLLDESMAVMGAAMGNIQVVDPRSGALRLIASRGLPQSFLSFFDTVTADGNCACGRALESGMPLLVEDVAQNPLFAGKESGRVMIAAGALAVQSIPLAGRDLHLLGMLSVHWRSVTRPTPEQTGQVEILIRRALNRLP